MSRWHLNDIEAEGHHQSDIFIITVIHPQTHEIVMQSNYLWVIFITTYCRILQTSTFIYYFLWFFNVRFKLFLNKPPFCNFWTKNYFEMMSRNWYWETPHLRQSHLNKLLCRTLSICLLHFQALEYISLEQESTSCDKLSSTGPLEKLIGHYIIIS